MDDIQDLISRCTRYANDEDESGSPILAETLRRCAAALSTPHQAIQELIKARDIFGWSPEVDEKINALRSLSTQPQQAGVKDSLTTDQAIELLVTALAESKGWMRGYSDSIIRDAIDRSYLMVPEQAGWKMVPVEPTPEMLIAGEAEFRSYCLRHMFGHPAVWSAMLNAAPLPPVPGQEGGG